MVKKKVDVAQTKLVKKPTIREIIGMITWPLTTHSRRNYRDEDFISCRYGDSPTIRSHVKKNLTEENGLKVLAYSVGRIVAYIAYESRKTIYSYVISAPSSGEGWENFHARQIPLIDCMLNVEDMVSNGYKGSVYTNPLVRRKKLMGKPLGTITLWKKQGLKYAYTDNRHSVQKGFDVLDVKEDCKTYWVHLFKGNDVRVFDRQFPVSNRSSLYLGHYEQFFNAVDESDFPVFVDELRPKLKAELKKQSEFDKSKRARFNVEEYEFSVVRWDVPDETKKSMKRKALLSSL